MLGRDEMGERVDRGRGRKARKRISAGGAEAWPAGHWRLVGMLAGGRLAALAATAPWSVAHGAISCPHRRVSNRQKSGGGHVHACRAPGDIVAVAVKRKKTMKEWKIAVIFMAFLFSSGHYARSIGANLAVLAAFWKISVILRVAAGGDIGTTESENRIFISPPIWAFAVSRDRTARISCVASGVEYKS